MIKHIMYMLFIIIGIYHQIDGDVIRASIFLVGGGIITCMD